jgi:hypothetical protein
MHGALTDLRALLQDHSWITIVGPPGAGKSWLAARAAPAGTHRVRCEGLQTADALQERVCVELDLPSDAAPPSRRWLLLDGLELHAPQLLTRWADAGARLLVTRTSPVQCAPEHCFPLAPMAPERGAAFVLERVDDPMWASSPREAAALLALVDALGGLPGSLLLLASRATLAEPTTLLASLEDSALSPLDWGLQSAWDALSDADQDLLARALALDTPLSPALAARMLGPRWEPALQRFIRQGWLRPSFGGVSGTRAAQQFVRARRPVDGIPALAAHVQAHPRETRQAQAELQAHASRVPQAALALVRWMSLSDPGRLPLVHAAMDAATPEQRQALASQAALGSRSATALAHWQAQVGPDPTPDQALCLDIGRAQAALHERFRVEPAPLHALLDRAEAAGELRLVAVVCSYLAHTYSLLLEIEKSRAVCARRVAAWHALGHTRHGLRARASQLSVEVDTDGPGAAQALLSQAERLRLHGDRAGGSYYAACAWMALAERDGQLAAARTQLPALVRTLDIRNGRLIVLRYAIQADQIASIVDVDRITGFQAASGNTTRQGRLNAVALGLVGRALQGDLEGAQRLLADFDTTGVPMERRSIRASLTALAEGAPFDGPVGPSGFERYLARACAARQLPRLVARTDGFNQVDLSRRRVPLRLWRHLLRARVQPGPSVVTAESLVAAGWPDERMAWESAVNRLHVALAQLRKLGLKGFLLRRDEGWELDPDALVILRDGAALSAP